MIKKEPSTCTLNFEFNIAQYGNAVIQKTCQITNLLTLSLLGFKCKQRYLRQKTQNTMCRQVRKLINQQRNITNAGTWALTKRFDSYEHEVNNTFSPVFTVERGNFFFFLIGAAWPEKTEKWMWQLCMRRLIGHPLLSAFMHCKNHRWSLLSVIRWADYKQHETVSLFRR